MAQSITSSKSNKRDGALKTVLLAGLVAGVLDITAASMMYYFTSGGKGPVNVLKFVASGVFGKTAFSGDSSMAFWGLLFHFIIAFAWAILFFLVYPKVPILARNKVLTGLLYGLFIWVIMNLVVLPMTNVPHGPIDFSRALPSILIIMLMVGLPIALIVHRHHLRRQAEF